MKVQPNSMDSTPTYNFDFYLNNGLLEFFHANRNDKKVKKFFKDLRALGKPQTEKAKRVLTPEQLEKMKQGRERKKQSTKTNFEE